MPFDTRAISLTPEKTADPLRQEFSRRTAKGHFQISLSSGILGYERKEDLSVIGDFYPLAEWGRSYSLLASSSGEIERINRVVRNETVATSENKVSSRHHTLSQQQLSPQSEEWEQVLKRIRAGFDIYSK